jgi:hypothetical protein
MRRDGSLKSLNVNHHVNDMSGNELWYVSGRLDSHLKTRDQFHTSSNLVVVHSRVSESISDGVATR